MADKEINPMVRMMIKNLIPMINKNISGLDHVIENQLLSIKLNPGEDCAAYLMHMENHEAIITTGVYGIDGHIIRVVKSQKFTEFIKEIIQKV